MINPQYLVVNNRFIRVIMHGSYDVIADKIPLKWLINPLRYQLTFKFSSGWVDVNEHGSARIKFNNFIYRLRNRRV